MSDEGGLFSEELDSLRQLRDELRLQAKLGEAELRDRLAAAEKRWGRLEGNLQLLRDEVRRDAGSVGEAAKLLVDEIRDSFDRIRRRL